VQSVVMPLRRDRRMESTIWPVAVWVIVFLTAACGPRTRRLRVAYLHGDVFSPSPMSSALWSESKNLNCELASETSVPPDQRGDLLLCGAQTEFAWSQTWLRGDIKSQIYDNSAPFTVIFHNGAHGGGRTSPPSWECKKVSTAIDCN
jgi:hypothetical protein